MWRSALLLVSVFSLVLVHPARATEWEPYDSGLSRQELRDTLNTYLQNDRLREARTGMRDPYSDDFAARLIRTYRSNPSSSVISIKEAPFPFMLIAAGVKDLYPALYDKTWTEKYKEVLENIPLEQLFDGFLQGILDGTLPKALKGSSEKIGECMAKKAMAGKDDSCKLDPSEKIDAPSIAAQAWIKIDCSLFNATSKCFTRQTLYDSAKDELIKARKTPEVRKLVADKFAEQFPVEFRKGFLAEMSGRLAGFPALVAQKFSGSFDEFWDARTPLAESDGVNANRMTIRGFAAGLRADIGTAALLAQQRDPDARGLAGALFYAAANRLLLLMGGTQAQWNGRNIVAADGDAIDPRDPKKAPVFATSQFGGWGVEKLPNGPAFTAWDWGNYDPTRAENPTPHRIFPGEFLVTGKGVPRFVPMVEPAETLSDLADLLMGGVDFLRYTRPDAVFARHFGQGAELEKVTDPKSPVIFPREGRMLAIGMMGGALMNLIAPNVGHAEQKVAGSPDFGLGLEFHDRVTLKGRDGQPTTVVGLSKMLNAASELRKVMTSDPDVPQVLKDNGPAVDTALQIGALVMGAQGQESDGGFREKLGVSMTQKRTLGDLVAGLRALTRAYDESEMLAILIRIKQSWLFFDKLWGAGQVPHAIEGVSGTQIAPSQLWRAINLWEETQKVVRPRIESTGLAPEINWGAWDRRFETLRRKLVSQLESDDGPGMVGD